MAPETARPERRPAAEEDTAADFRSHIAILAGPSISAGDLETSIDALLTALSGGYGPDVRMEMVVALVPRIDESLHSLLAAHLRNVRDEALDFENDRLVWEAERLLKSLEPSE